MERFYRFADITLRITANEEDLYRQDGVLLPFRVEGPDFSHTISYQIVDTLPVPEGDPIFRGLQLQVFRQGQVQTICLGDTDHLSAGAHTQIRREGNHSQVQVLRSKIPDRIPARFVLNTLEIEYHIAHHGGFLLHSSFISWNGKAILFTAPSGTGKSTQAELWKKYRGAEIINGDRTAVMVSDGGIFAHGVPYCGTSGICGNAELPLAAIVYLTQSPKSSVQPLTGLRAFRRVWEGCSVHTWDREDMELCTNAVMEAIRQVPVLHLACTPDEDAVNVLDAYLRKG